MVAEAADQVEVIPPPLLKLPDLLAAVPGFLLSAAVEPLALRALSRPPDPPVRTEIAIAAGAAVAAVAQPWLRLPLGNQVALGVAEEEEEAAAAVE